VARRRRRPDLSLYPRFSGSPLVDVNGRVIGLNTGGLSRRQTLTVPATTIERVVDALLTRGGRIPRGYLGVALQAVQGGVIILGVEPASPADNGGLIVGDIITAIAGQVVEDADDVHAQLGAGTVGKQLTLDVRRGGSPHHVQVTVGERPEPSTGSGD
jgi:S1-C subfamily serine protease